MSLIHSRGPDEKSLVESGLCFALVAAVFTIVALGLERILRLL